MRIRPPRRFRRRMRNIAVVALTKSMANQLGGFGITVEEKRKIYLESTEQICNILAMDPYPGYNGKYFDMPCRNLVPKPVQRPHPPVWVACSQRETIRMAARLGIGALTFAFVDPLEASSWVEEYYNIIKSDACVPIGHSVNANICMVSSFSCHADRDIAIERGLKGFEFFGYALGSLYGFGAHKPGRTNLWKEFETVFAQRRQSMSPEIGQALSGGRGGIDCGGGGRADARLLARAARPPEGAPRGVAAREAGGPLATMDRP